MIRFDLERAAIFDGTLDCPACEVDEEHAHRTRRSPKVAARINGRAGHSQPCGRAESSSAYQNLPKVFREMNRCGCGHLKRVTAIRCKHCRAKRNGALARR